LDNDTSIPSRGATVVATQGNVLRIMSSVIGDSAEIYGLVLTSGDQLYITRAAEQVIALQNCKIGLTTTAGKYIYLNTADGCAVFMDDVEILFNGSAQFSRASHGCRVELNRLSFSGVSPSIFIGGGGSGGANIVIKNTDLSFFGSTVLTDFLGVSAADICLLYFQRCLIASGAALVSSTVLQKGSQSYAESIGIGAVTDTYNYFEYKGWVGISSEDTNTYRTAGSVDSDGINFSGNMVSNANASLGNPLKFELANFWVNIADYGATIDFDIHTCLENALSAVTVLTDIDWWVELEYSDGADNAMGAVISSRGNINSPANHSTTTGAWTAAANNVQMVDTITLAKGTNAGEIASGVVSVYVCLAEDIDTRQANDLFFVDRKVDVS